MLVNNQPVSISNDNTYTFKEIDDNYIISATFEASSNNYTINVENSENGVVESLDGNHTAPKGSNKTYRIIPDYGYVVKDVLVDCNKVNLTNRNTYTFINVNENHTLNVIFEKFKTSESSNNNSNNNNNNNNNGNSGSSSSSSSRRKSSSSNTKVEEVIPNTNENNIYLYKYDEVTGKLILIGNYTILMLLIILPFM